MIGSCKWDGTLLVMDEFGILKDLLFEWEMGYLYFDVERQALPFHAYSEGRFQFISHDLGWS